MNVALTAKQRADRYKAKQRAAGKCTNCPSPVVVKKDGQLGRLCAYHFVKQRQWSAASRKRKLGV